MSDSPVWRPLPVQADGVPNLLVSTFVNSSSYSVHITDLANVWTETLDRKAICMRGFKEDTSIDPSEGQDQMLLFLKRIRASLDSSLPGHGDTSLMLSRNSTKDGLVLHITCILPQPLKPLKWPMYLDKRPPSCLATELVLPLIRAHLSRTEHINSLVTLLRQKDGVITRLVDKLEATGTGLEQVFHPLSGRRKVSRAAAEERVRGLAPFNETDFHHGDAASAQDHNGTDGTLDLGSLLQDVFGGSTGFTYRSDLDFSASPALDEWWTKLGRGKGVALVGRGKSADHREEATPSKQQHHRPGSDKAPVVEDDDETESEEDQDFQVQATPPHLARTKKQDSPLAEQQEATDDGNKSTDEDGAIIPDSVPSLSTPAKATRSATGANKGKQTGSPPPRASQPSRITMPAERGDSSETASEADDDAQAPPAHSPTPASQKRSRGGGIGWIGRKAEARSTETRASRKRTASPADEEAAQQPAKTRRLGVIGQAHAASGRRTEPSDEDDDAGNRPPRKNLTTKEESPPPPPPPPETEEERADKKRLQLQRELDKRAGAAAKKKRKF